jgi:hypothetical protein
MNTGIITGLGKLNGTAALYSNTDLDCKMEMSFQYDALTVKQQGPCGFGMNVSAEGNYVRKNKKAPAFSKVVLY